MRLGQAEFREIWLVDFEFSAPSGERPSPICVVARDLVTKREVRLWEDELQRTGSPPYPVDSHSLFVSYYASAEVGCHLALGWPTPTQILDLYVEFRNATNGRRLPCGAGLLGALSWFGLSGIEAAEKDELRALAQRGGPWTSAERAALLAYCTSDVDSLERLFSAMLPSLDTPRALLRGNYMNAAAHIEWAGTPIDIDALSTLQENWTGIQDQLIQRINPEFGVYEGRTFKADSFRRWLTSEDIPWPRLETGALALDDDTFKAMARSYPVVTPLRQLRDALSQMRLSDLSVGSDGRNRCILSAFSARTGRNQPSNSRFIFGMPSWLRGLIRPTLGSGLAYIDWEQQEFGIAAALSKDSAMIDAYLSGDPYLAFAKQAGAAPKDATRVTHELVREQFKACALAVQYGMGAEALAVRIGQPPFKARELLRLHHETYRQFWRWSDAAVDCANLHGTLSTVFGWTIHLGTDTNSRSLRNFPMQANGAEMLRLACSLTTSRGITLCAPVHDAVLIEAPLPDLEAAVSKTQSAMGEASELVLDGLRLRTEAKAIRYPDRFEDARGSNMWETIWQVVAEITASPCAEPPKIGVQHRNASSALTPTCPISSSVSCVGVSN